MLGPGWGGKKVNWIDPWSISWKNWKRFVAVPFTHWTHKIFFFFFWVFFQLHEKPKTESQETSKLDTEVLFSIEFSVSHYYSFLLLHDTKLRVVGPIIHFFIVFQFVPLEPLRKRLNNSWKRPGKKNLKPIIKINFFFLLPPFFLYKLYNFFFRCALCCLTISRYAHLVILKRKYLGLVFSENLKKFSFLLLAPSLPRNMCVNCNPNIQRLHNNTNKHIREKIIKKILQLFIFLISPDFL